MNNIFTKLKNWYQSSTTSKGSKTLSSSYNTKEEDQIDFSYNNPWLSIQDTRSTNS